MRGKQYTVITGCHLHYDQIELLNATIFNICDQQFVACGQNQMILFSADHAPTLTMSSQHLQKPAKIVLKSLFEQFATSKDGTVSLDNVKDNVKKCTVHFADREGSAS